MTFLFSLFLYPSTVVIGFLFATLLGVKNFWEKLGVGWLLGTSLLTYVFFLLYDKAGWRYNAVFTAVLLIASTVILLVLVRVMKNYTWLKFRAELQQHFRRWQSFPSQKLSLLMLALVAVPIAFTFLQNFHWPVMDWDAIALYDFRAKVFAMSGGMEDGIIRGYFLHYPLYTSLLHTFSYVFGIQSARTWYSLFYLASLLVFYELLQRHVSQKQALLGSFFLAISPRIFQHSQMTYTNLPHAMFLALGYLYLWEWWRAGRRVDVILGAGLVAASTWVRLTEPLWLPALGILALGWWKWRSQWGLVILSVALIILLRFPWTQFVAFHDNLSIANPLQIGQGLQLPQSPWELLVRIQEVTQFFWKSIYPLFGDYVPPLVIAGLYLIYKEKWQELWEYFFFLVLVGFICAGIFLFSFQFKGWQDIPDSAARMSMFLLPLVIYLVTKSKLWSVPKKITG